MQVYLLLINPVMTGSYLTLLNLLGYHKYYFKMFLSQLSFLFNTTQTTPGPSQNMDYITIRCRATTCHECTMLTWESSGYKRLKIVFWEKIVYWKRILFEKLNDPIVYISSLEFKIAPICHIILQNNNFQREYLMPI